jgi:probable phosphoglycerate mutase
VGRRADRVIAMLRNAAGDAIVFAHGHILRVLAARWVDLAPAGGSRLALDPATISVLGYEREVSVIRLWNEEPSP